MRKLIFVAGIALLLIGGVAIWRSMNPPRTDQEIITANVEDIARSASAKRLSTVLNYLHKDFKYGSMTKKDIKTGLAATFWQYQKIDVQVSGVDVEVNGDEATSSGHYSVSTRSTESSGAETFAGDFEVKWRKQEDGEWKAMEGEGGKLPGF